MMLLIGWNKSTNAVFGITLCIRVLEYLQITKTLKMTFFSIGLKYTQNVKIRFFKFK